MDEANGTRPARTTSAAREGPRRRALPRAARRAGARPGRAPLAGALQPRVPARLRRDAAPVPADAPARAGGRAAAQHRPVGGGDLLRRRAAAASARSRRASGACTALSPTAYRAAHPPAASRARIPTCVCRRTRARSPSRFREDSAAAARLASPATIDDKEDDMLKQLTHVRSGSTTRTRRSPSTPRSSGWSCART